VEVAVLRLGVIFYDGLSVLTKVRIVIFGRWYAELDFNRDLKIVRHLHR